MAEKNSIPQFVNSESIMSDSNYVKWLSDLKSRIRIAQLKAAIKVNEELHKLYWSLGEDICNKQKLYKWGTNFIKQLSLDLRSAFPNVEGFSWSNLYKIRKWYLFYSSQNEFLYQAGTKLETLESTSVPMPAILLRVPWRHQTVIVSKCKIYKWGTNFIKQLSLDLRSAFPNVEGFSWSNLYKIRKWYLFYSSQNEFLYQAGTKLETLESTSVPMPAILLRVPWRHQTVIVSKCKTILEAIFYLNQVIEGNLSRNELEHIIEAHLYEQKGKALNNFESTLPAPQKALANEMLKDPYKLDFLSMAGDFSEKDLEDKLAQNITRFLLELGKGFAYVGRQMELTTPSGKSYFPDMVFYHTKLKCYVVIELKVVDFMPEFVGKLNFYVAAADELLKDEGDNPSIGILLCKDKDSSVVEWALRGITTPLGVASYQLQEVYERTLLEMKEQSTKNSTSNNND